MKVYHIKTKEWFSSEELQRKLDDGFDFECNECHEDIRSHVKTLAEGIFCNNCFNEIMEDLK